MRILLYPLIFSILLVAGCYDPDPPLLTTPLPNGYSFDSNDGRYGYIKTPDKKRMGEHFGILSDGTEAWCEEFAWQKYIVICKLSEVRFKENKNENISGYFIIDTATSEINKIYSDKETNQYWFKKFGQKLPEMKTKFKTTKRK